MARKAKLTKRTIDATKPEPKEFVLWDAEITGFGLRVQPTGRKVYLLKYRPKGGAQVKLKIGVHGDITADQARKIAGEWHGEVAGGGDPRARLKADPGTSHVTFKAIAENFIKRHVEKQGSRKDGEIAPLRSAAEIRRTFDVYVLPEWGNRPFHSIKRSDVAKLLDTIEYQNGPVQADRALAYIRKLFNWYATRDDNFTSPIVRGMARTNPSERKRNRVLSDDEIRLIWPLLEGTFGGLVKALLLTGQRREKVATMRWDDIDADGLWTIPKEPREKNNPGTLPLSRAALNVIEPQPKIDKCPYVFAGRTKGPFAGFSPSKRNLDAAIAKALREDDPKAEPLPGWTLHDLRRSSKTLMVRAAVRPDVSERVLGHVIPGVEGVYDVHDYNDQKADALNRLAGLVELILNPPEDNVATLKAARK